MVKIQLFSLLRILLKEEQIELPPVDGETVAQLLERLQQQRSTPFLHKLLTEDGSMHAGTIILVNRHNIHHIEGLQTPVNDTDVVAMFPPGAGG
jgi:molybdopterin synthase sulfur carrier subunit